MGKYQGYQKYKDSGVEWLGEIPEHWEVSKAKFISEIFIPQRNKHELNFDDGLPWLTMDDMLGDRVSQTKFKVTKEAFIKAGSKSLKKGSVIASCIGNFSICAINDVEVIINQQLQAFIPNNHIIPEYLRELVKISSDYFQMIATAATVVYVNQAGFANMPISLPPLEEQEKIAQFLDYKTKQIDKLIAKKETLIEKLDEKRTSLISHAVTKGLDVNVPMKDSGIEWLGEIPQHWDICKVKNLATTITKGTTPSTEGQTFTESGIRYLKAENIFNNKIILQPEFFISKETDNILKRSRLKVNDILFVIAGATIGKTAIVYEDYIPANTNQAVSLIRPNNRVLPEFLHLWLQSDYTENILKTFSVQSAQPNISMEKLGDILVCLPPLQEQIKIKQYLDQKTAQIEEQKTKIQQAIDILKEYRTALITNAVTGKIDVSQVDIS